MWKPSITSNEVLIHSKGPWKNHAYVKVVGGDYYYPDGYNDRRTVSDLISSFKEKRKVAKKMKNQRKALEKARATRAANKKSADERTRLVEKGTRDELIKNRSKLSTDEMDKALDRLKKEELVNQKLADLAPKSEVYTRIEKFNKYADQAKVIAKGTQNFIDAYNTGAGIYNAVMQFKGNDKRLPKVNYSSGGDGGNKNNNNNNGGGNNNGGNKKAPKPLQAIIKKADEINNQNKKKNK